MDQVSVGLTSNTKVSVMHPARFVQYMNTVFFVVYQHYILGITGHRSKLPIEGPLDFSPDIHILPYRK